MLASRMVGAFPSPEVGYVPNVTVDMMSQLIGTSPMYPPSLSNLPDNANPTSFYQPWLAGQLQVTSLAVVDEWGQAVFLTDSSEYQSFTMTLSPEMVPSQ